MEETKIAQRLIELRGDIPRKVVAKEVGITKNALCNYENGIRIPKDPIKIKIAEYYGVTVQSIFFEKK